MDQQTLIIMAVIAVLAIALVWARARSGSTPETGIDRTEEATRRLYREEDAARDRMDDGTV